MAYVEMKHEKMSIQLKKPETHPPPNQHVFRYSINRYSLDK